jgi:RES domain
MSPSIWTRCAARCRPRTITLVACRVVESQHVVSTRKLVDSGDEQALLEELVDRVKPPLPPEPEFRKLHYLLSTSFRHPPLRYGSRFGTRAERGIWYGSRELSTCFAEVAYYRLLFLEGTTADLGTLVVELTAFRVPIRSPKSVDLTRAPFTACADEISDKVSYRAAQTLGAEMRAAGIRGFLYASARVAGEGTNVGLFVPGFAANRPTRYEAWICASSRDAVEMTQKSLGSRHARFAFPRAQFLVGGKLPSPAT